MQLLALAHRDRERPGGCARHLEIPGERLPPPRPRYPPDPGPRRAPHRRISGPMARDGPGPCDAGRASHGIYPGPGPDLGTNPGRPLRGRHSPFILGHVGTRQRAVVRRLLRRPTHSSSQGRGRLSGLRMCLVPTRIVLYLLAPSGRIGQSPCPRDSPQRRTSGEIRQIRRTVGNFRVPQTERYLLQASSACPFRTESLRLCCVHRRFYARHEPVVLRP